MIQEVDQFTKVNVSKINEVIKFCNDMDSEKAEKNDTYTKSQVDSFVSSINSSIASVNSSVSSKANSSDVYSKSEVDALVSSNVITSLPSSIFSFSSTLPSGGSWAYISIAHRYSTGSGNDSGMTYYVHAVSTRIAAGGTNVKPSNDKKASCYTFAIRVQ